MSQENQVPQVPQVPNMPNMNEIFKMAQQVASNIASNQTEEIDPKNMDMGKVLSQVTSSVSKMITPEMIEKMSNMGNFEDNQNIQDTIANAKKNKSIKSKINFDDDDEEDYKKQKSKKESSKSSKSSKKADKIEELEDSENEYESIAPRTKDLHFSLNVTLEELYSGKVKKLAVRRKRIITDGKKKALAEEKKKLSVNIEPGMYDEQVITFNKQADEKEGFETGDIVITLCCADHDEYEREGDNLLVEKEISLYEAYDCKMTITHLDGREINISSPPINIFGEELECYRKLKGFGMPIHGSENEFGDLIIKFKPVLPENLTQEQLKTLEELFPKVNQTKNLPKENNYELEMATESDFEYSDSDDSDSEYDSDDDSEYDSEDDEDDDDDDEDEEESEENLIEEVEEEKPKSSKKTKK
jgi:DnaJ-class molecular chaperone